ncbi:hypothetical protein [Caproiciproducens galactitolivorans]|uniref:Uncharacterized protein n=1 Tax=Caproiciproducens galactitolivorans TaxID=642589 RepID=A0ABT4BVK6_9FIRM|nr:hypothetical protein [Caproiciproducens galactitolivorans]MCY1714370.1 hypothetical protein [Caproiciproducens galactitolivorans]
MKIFSANTDFYIICYSGYVRYGKDFAFLNNGITVQGDNKRDCNNKTKFSLPPISQVGGKLIFGKQWGCPLAGIYGKIVLTNAPLTDDVKNGRLRVRICAIFATLKFIYDRLVSGLRIGIGEDVLLNTSPSFFK